MAIKTYKETDVFPCNCWFADWQPYHGKSNIIGDILLRKRDTNSTVAIINIPVIRGTIELDEAERIAQSILEATNQ